MSEARPAMPPHPESAAGTKTPTTPTRKKSPRGLRILIGVIVLGGIGLIARPWIAGALNSITTDDAFVSGHLTIVAARVTGQVAEVRVEDDNRVHRGDVLFRLDKEPYQIKVDIARAAVVAAESDLEVTRAKTRALEGHARSLRFNLEHAIQDVDNKVAVLRSRVATLDSKKATLAKAQAAFDRAAELLHSEVYSKDEFDVYDESRLVALAQVEEAEQGVYQVRLELGLPAKPMTGDDLTQVPADLDQSYSGVRQAQGLLIEAVAQLGVLGSLDSLPKQMIAEFYKRDPEGNVDRIFAELLKTAPEVKQAEARLEQAHRALAATELDLRYCEVVAEIDGVVSRREINPGNTVAAGQAVMALRSVSDIWIDANFKETQLGELRIGQPVDLVVDMYGKRRPLRGRISGFSMGTGASLAILPPENATGNFVKVVQRLPVRIDLVDYDPETTPLFVGLSVNVSARLGEKPTGKDAGKILQPHLMTATKDSPPVQRP